MSAATQHMDCIAHRDIDGALLGVYELPYVRVFAVDDDSDEIRTVLYSMNTGHYDCDGEQCPGGVRCAHIRRVMAARAGF